MLSNIGASIGKAFIIPNLQRPMSIAPNSIIIKFLDNITTKYVYFIILSHFGQSILKGFTAGTAMPKFNQTQLRETLLPYPSYDEQKRIVYKIEKHIALISMDYMKNLNAIDEQMADELIYVIDQVEKDPEVKVAVLKGTVFNYSVGSIYE